MTRRRALLALAASLAFANPRALPAQTVPRGLETLPADVAAAWIEPLPRALGPTLATGFFRDARPGALGLGLRLSLGRFSGTDGAFVPPLPGSVSFGGSAYDEPYVLTGGPTSPTVAGEGPGAELVPRPGSAFEAALFEAGEDPASHRIPLPGGLDLPGAPVPAVDLSLGLGSVAAVTGRFFPRLELDDDLGDIGGFGAGALVSVDRFLPLPRLDAALTFGIQRMEIGSYLRASATAAGVLLSTGPGPLRMHVHGQRVGWRADVRWRTRNPDGVAGLPADGAAQVLRFDPDADLRLALGASLHVAGRAVSVEVSASTPRVLSAHLRLGSR